MIEIEVVVDEGATLPTYASEEAAGADVRAHIDASMILDPGCSALVPTGLRFSIPQGYEIQVRPRSGLALKHQVTVLNTPGTVDSDYRGEIKVILINHGKTPFTIEPNMRVAQLVLMPVCQAAYTPAKALATSARGEGGFGHTGMH